MKKRLIYLGLGLIFLVCTILIVTNVRLGVVTSGPSTTALPFQIQSARQSYAQVEKWSTQWAPDAGLVAGSTSVTRQADQQGKAGGWTFQIYSPTTQRLALVLVDHEQVRVLRVIDTLYPQTAFQTNDWKIDSETFMESWWAETGKTIWNVPQAQTLYLHLGIHQRGIPSWQITVMSENGTVLNTWEARADTGEPLPNLTSGGGQ